jgi:voltage-gated potassium channel
LIDITIDENLKKIGIEKEIEILFCMHTAYTKNLFVTLSARNLNKNLKIISLAASLNDESKMRLAGADHTVNPYDLGSHRIFRVLQKPKIFDVFDNIIYSDSEIEIAEVEIPSGSTIVGEQFRKLSLEEEFDVAIIGVHSSHGERDNGKFYYNTHRIYHKIKQNDILVVIGHVKNIEALKRRVAA